MAPAIAALQANRRNLLFQLDSGCGEAPPPSPTSSPRLLPPCLRWIFLGCVLLLPWGAIVIPAASACNLRPLFWQNVTSPGYR